MAEAKKEPEVKKVPTEPQPYMCIRECYMKHETEKPMRYKVGQVVMFKKGPEYHFEAVNKVHIDFAVASADTLVASTSWKAADMTEYASKTFGISLDSKLPKVVLVDKFIDARFRSVGMVKYGG